MRRFARPGRRLRVDPRDAEFVVRSERNRPGDVCVRPVVVGRRWFDRLLFAGASRDQSQSADGAALRVGERRAKSKEQRAKDKVLATVNWQSAIGNLEMISWNR